MEDSIDYTIETDGLTFPIEVYFTAVRGYVSYDYYEPSEPDEIKIDNYKMYGNQIPMNLYRYIMEHYQKDIYEKIEECLNGRQYDGMDEPDF